MEKDGYGKWNSTIKTTFPFKILEKIVSQPMLQCSIQAVPFHDHHRALV